MIAAVRRTAWQPYLRLVQIGGTLLLIGLLLRKVEWSALPPLLAGLRWSFIGLSLAIVLLCHLINVERWRYLLPQRVGYRRLLIVYGAGLFSNNFLPTGIGGDGVRAAMLSRDVPMSRAIMSVGLDRALGLIGLCTLVLPGLWLGLPPGLALVGGALSPAGVGALLIVGALLLGVAALAWRLPPVRARGLRLYEIAARRWLGVDHLAEGANERWLQRLAGGYGFSLLSTGGLVLAYWLALLAIGVTAGPAVALWLLVAGSLSLLLPIAVNGLGLQEGIYVMLLVHYGFAPGVGLSFALLARLLMVLPSMLGGLLSLWKQR